MTSIGDDQMERRDGERGNREERGETERRENGEFK
jgi:hypothetical protein